MDYATYKHWLEVKKHLEETGHRDSGIYIAACHAVSQRPKMPPYKSSDVKIGPQDVF